MTVKIVTDNSADINPELAQQLGITVVPLYLSFGDKVYRDGVDIGADEFYQKLETSSVYPTTSAPSPGDFATTYEGLAKETDEIVSIHISSKVSATHAAALQGKEALAGTRCQIEVVDSQWVTMALGLVTMVAAKAAQAGENLHQVLEEIKVSILCMRVLGVFDTLKYLLLGGRVSKTKAIVGSVLNVKPLFTMRDGELAMAGIARTRSKGVGRLYELVKSALDIQNLAIVHATTPEEASSLKELISSIVAKECIYVARLGPALGVHGGPGTLIVALREGKDRTARETTAGERKRRLPLPLPGQHFSCYLSQGRKLDYSLRLKLVEV